jgi:DNA/RNA-binding domain of Phe-tRNA-synthetase-like protein
MTAMEIDVRLADREFVGGVVVARGVTVGASPPELSARLDELVARRAADADFPPPAVKGGVRAMLRRGGFKPSGRNKPASEYLAQAAREGRFPRINNLVDINNLLSLESGLPISLLDLDAVGERVVLRYGTEGERYVFNPAGQEIDLKGLICACRADDGGASTPLGNAIKDSMAGKLRDATRDVIGVVYATREAASVEVVEGLVREFGELLTRFGGAAALESEVVTG